MKRFILTAALSLITTAACAGAAEQALEACNKANATDNRKAYLCQARTYSDRNDYAHALEALTAADQLAKTSLEHIVTILLIGNNYKELKDLDKAIDQYENGRELAKKERNQHFEMISLNNIGMALEAKGDYALAVENFLLAQKLAANNNERAESHAYLASAYSAMNNHEKAIEHQIKAAFIEEHSNDFDHYANAGLELGRVYLRAKQYADAEKTLGKVLENIILNKDVYWESKGKYYLSLAKREQGNGKDADILLKQAKDGATGIGASDLLELFSSSSN